MAVFRANLTRLVVPQCSGVFFMVTPNLVQVSCMKAYKSTQCRPTLFLVNAGETEKMIHEWDGLTRYLDSVMSRFFKVENYEVSRHTSASFKGK